MRKDVCHLYLEMNQYHRFYRGQLSKKLVIFALIVFIPVGLFSKESGVASTISTDFLTRKKQTASIILQGLSLSCNQLGTIVGAEKKKEKQQGVLNVLSTVLGTAAQLAAPSEEQVQQSVQQTSTSDQQPNKDQVPTKLELLTDMLIDKSKEEPCCKNLEMLPPTIALIETLECKEKKEALIALLLSSERSAELYVNELVDLLTQYLISKLPDIAQYIKSLLIEKLYTPPNTRN